MRSYFLRDAGYLRLLFDYFEVKGGYVDVFGGMVVTRRLPGGCELDCLSVTER